MKARIIIGANYGDEGKGTVTARYVKDSSNALNVLTNGGSQRGHSILTKDGSITYRHFGSGTYYGADNYYSRYFILNPVQFTQEYNELIIKPKKIYRDAYCKWTTIYDMLANLISERAKKRHASCCMGIWNTIRRTKELGFLFFDKFMLLSEKQQLLYLNKIKTYYEKELDIPNMFKDIWNNPALAIHFINDCKFMYKFTEVIELKQLNYEDIIFENGQGLLLSDTGADTYDTTPSNTGITYSLELLKDLNADDITAHYVTRPYLTRHGDGSVQNEKNKQFISQDIKNDRTNHYNEFQGDFRYGVLDIKDLHKRITDDAKNINFILEVTHCDEMDNTALLKAEFDNVNTYDNALV